MYDEDLSVEQVKQMRDSTVSKMRNLKLYEYDGEQYLAFLKWNDHQKPSHAKPSKILPPPKVNNSKITDSVTEHVNESVHPSIGQVSIVKVSSGEESPNGVPGEEKKSTPVLGSTSFEFPVMNDNELTEYLMTLLTQNKSELPLHHANVINEFWKQRIGNSNSDVRFGAMTALKKYQPPVIARALVRFSKSNSGAHITWKCIEPILEEELNKEK